MELDAAYECMVGRIKHSSRYLNCNLGIRVLMWLHLAKRPLKLNELQHALAVELEPGKSGHYELDKDKIPSRKRLLDCCLGLVIVDDETMTVRLTHYTLEEYFKRSNHSNEYFPNGCSTATDVCLTYLNFGQVKADHTRQKDVVQRLEQFPFLEYAACHWGHYAAHDYNDVVPALALKILRTERGGSHHVALYVLCRSLWSYFWYNRSSSFMGIHAAASFGLIRYMTQLTNQQSWDARDGYGRTPLSYAASRGHESVVRLLLERNDVDANSKDKDAQTPLTLAAIGGHENAVRLLLERNDVDANSKDKHGHTPLTWAVVEGHKHVVQLLREHNDVDANLKDKDDQTLLALAAVEGHKNMMRLNDMGANSRVYSRSAGRTLAACYYQSRRNIIEAEDDFSLEFFSQYSRAGYSYGEGSKDNYST